MKMGGDWGRRKRRETRGMGDRRMGRWDGTFWWLGGEEGVCCWFESKKGRGVEGTVGGGADTMRGTTSTVHVQCII